MEKLTHFNEKGQSRMVDVTQKDETIRVAVAVGKVLAKLETLQLIADRKFSKGDVLEVARIAGIMATKRTADLIPLCHPIPITGVEVSLSINQASQSIEIEAEVQAIGRTGVEMEALTAVSTAALTVYDMCKSVDREMEISAVYLTKKTGGKSGTFIR
ncbi:TPA: cyclic pyranopterin monophosphate synthase MoaC [Candidatus Poribacteria bacterium]|jgi:cyclic pyranopterin phosphate synthase|nr:cyclic pyranopterin monophosphate synthase MoaC [Candidatus Poribacteria bacterium]HIA65385.1 cyclic pyranopterin monophosphate synthase MoaC [Candidatus Poribacteria bacterium]HIB91463.1 cyclic pyranopterin monophosphate synthase MoaC [Candidatus Poribacteria bacterium]HIB98273.1 cyclic pyranopterin monophosphate synthase MoaC [Candidatus Poribacteria bacterium]HIM12971.1 cyclic pyranopterin monophosphate synthase MoaC [Candidatus Poribacteria bacterium]